MSEDCIFCKIIAGQIPSKTIYESVNVKAFLDIFPVSEGHTVVVPKKHYYNLLDMPDKELGPFFEDLKKVAQILKDKLRCDGFNVVQNNFPAAGQVVPHFHYHIIPRMTGDEKLKLKVAKKQATTEELDSIAGKLK